MKVEKPTEDILKKLNVDAWPVWEKEVSTFDWAYSEKEVCYILEGKAKVKAEDGDIIEFGVGDLVTFSSGLNCVWEIEENIKKYYKFG
ncbi:MAG: cupin domain-containing protein [Candidatus Omnitrophica bacterium]|nr:cupin domain-containing protein [Candidatus Omnitrophota bacterium]